MALTLLFDLDDTLLVNNVDTFLPAYLKALGKHLAQHVNPQVMVPNLLAATQKMVENTDPRVTLEQAFDNTFYPAIGHRKEDLRATLADFYERVFPSLQPLTTQRQAAISLVQEVVARGHTAVVATNPLFPYRAIEHRVEWAGFAPHHSPFAILTTYEHFHFSKPNPAYFAEILAQLGWPDRPAVMIGNSMEEDLIPAAQIGLPGFWITDTTEGNVPMPHPLGAQGQMQDVLPWLEKIEDQIQTEALLSPKGMIGILQSTPAAFAALTQDLSDRQWHKRPSPEEWSATEILCHLRDVDAEINLPRLQKVIAGDVPFLPGINADPWTEERQYGRQDGAAALREFTETRIQLLQLLQDLPAESWQLNARHAIFGPTTLQELVSFITTHDRAHIQQLLAAAQQTA